MREMKNSGIEWIGDIPHNWSVKKLKYLCGIKSGEYIPKEEYIDGGIYEIIGANGCVGKTNKINNYEPVLTTGRVGTIGTVHKINKAWITDNTLIVSSKYGEDREYLYWVMQNFDYGFMTTGTAMPLITAKKLLEQYVPCFSIEEKHRLCNYLDEKCSKIDSIIEKQQKIIEKLKEYKLSIITEVVTKGLNPDVEMKDSRDLRIGYIPISWDKVKITRILDYSCPYPIGDGDHGLIKTNDYKDEGIPYIRVQNLGWGTDLLLDNVVYISEEDHNRIIGSELHPKDVLFCKTGATIGKTGMIPDSIPISNTTSHVGKISIDARYNARFVFYYLSSFIGYEQFWDIACLKSTRPELSIEEIKRINISIPNNKSEQDEIVHYLDNVCVQIDNRINKSISICEKLKEYKKSLIYEVVTGKKEV